MSKYVYSEEEKNQNRVLMYQEQQLRQISFPDSSQIASNISDSEALLRSLGYGMQVEKAKANHTIQLPPKVMVVPRWDELCREASLAVKGDCELEALFTPEELEINSKFIKQLNSEFNALHRLDAVDYSICAMAGIIAAAVDILLVGIPVKTSDGLRAGPLSNFIRQEFAKKFPPEEMEKLANQKSSKVPYDAQDNRNTSTDVSGLSSYYHRLLSLGHDPLIGFLVGVFDILNGKMTTIDKDGKIVSQVMECYSDRKETNIFAAIAKQFRHLISDVNTSMGLPVPMMGLFNLLQFGSIGEDDQTIAEIVQGMYYEGYDFIHFCSMSVPTMIIEVIVRLLYSLKRIKEGHAIKDSIPVSLRHDKHPKLASMLFIAHSSATAINAGKVYFTKNPMSINYPQWMAFARYSYKQLKWVLLKKPELRDKYVSGKLYEEFDTIYQDIESTFDDFSKDYIVIFTP